MSSPKLNLPMLSPYLLGEVMSSHDGVSCYPAIRRGTDEKYIVKVISIPASQSKLDALLLTGALSDKDAALDYFMTLSKDVMNQTDILRRLSHQEGFVPYLDGQIQPMEGDVGYHVYLLGTYKQSLERIFRTDLMTHADVTNLGLDLCAALAASRRTGYLYVDLKPGNIFRDPEQGFRIGDVGFIALPSLKYASLPDKYRSSYTAPELADDMAVINSTVDIYALGLVLYQAYNGGVLPFEGAAPAEILPPPVYADYEMAEIILKACHPDPKQRWQEPTKMAHALIDYLQTYGAPETPIIPPVLDRAEEEEEPQEEPFLPEADPQQLQQEMEALENADPDELAFLSGLVSDETAPNEENTADVPDEVMTEELSEMFAQADELIFHDLPEPPVAPEPVFAPMPEPIVLEEEHTPIEEAPDQVDAAAEETEDTPAEEEPEILPEVEEEPELTPIAEEKLEEPEVPTPAAPAAQKKADREDGAERTYAFPWKLAVAAVVMLLLMIGCFIAQNYYENHYLLQVDDLVLTHDQDTLTVQVVSQIDETLLRVVCTDSYGNSTTSNVVNGIATFAKLNPGTHYTVKVEVSGHHKLTGTLSDSFTTPAQTQILSFTAGMGPDDCSVSLNFTVTGPETGNWIVICSADGVEEKRVAFTGRSVIVADLVAGAHYTFTLTSPDGLYMAGKTQTEFVATNILYAQNLTITACGGGSLTAQWQQPADGTVTEWRVRCYNESGYNVTVTTSDLSYTFTDLDHSTPCTVEVTAVGMNHSVSTSISAEPITITDFQCVAADAGVLVVVWSYSGTAPVQDWLLCYNVDGAEYAVSLIEPTVCLMAIPVCNYQFTIKTASGNDVFNSTHAYSTQDLSYFANYGITANDLSPMTVILPGGEDWDLDDIGPDSYRNVFAADEQAGILLTSGTRPVASENSVLVDIVIYDANGQVVTYIASEMVWDAMWDNTNCLLPIAELPQDVGEYIVQIFFDGALVCRQDIAVTEPIADDTTQQDPAI